MIWLVWAALWFIIAAVIIICEEIYYARKPWAKARRFEGLISLTDFQRRMVYLFWPLALLVFVIVCFINWPLIWLERWKK